MWRRRRKDETKTKAGVERANREKGKKDIL